ncbi:MAG: hypothetical protein WC280_03885 [Patescibacteria group bacterium]
MKKKSLLFLFLIIFIIFGFSRSDSDFDLRRSFLVYAEGDSEISSLLEYNIKTKLKQQGKYKVMTRDDVFLKNISDILGKVDNSVLDVDFLVYLKILESFPSKEIMNDQVWWEYNIIVKCEVIKVSTGESFYSQLFSSQGTSYVGRNQSDIEAYFYARRNAINNLTTYVVKALNNLFRLKANILRIEDNYLFIDGGRNIGIHKGMLFEFVNTVEINEKSYDEYSGKLVAEEVWDSESKLKILEKPRSFDYKNENVFVIENPFLSPVRTMFNVYYLNESFKSNGLGLEIGIDNYEHLYVGTDFQFLFDRNLFSLDIDFNLGYLNYFAEMDSSILLGTSLGLKNIYTKEGDSHVFFKVTPKIDYSNYVNKNFGLTCGLGYNILLPTENDVDLGNNITIKLGISLRF